MPTDYLIKINDMIDDVCYEAPISRGRAKRMERDVFIKVLTDIANKKLPCEPHVAAGVALRVLDARIHTEHIDHDMPLVGREL